MAVPPSNLSKRSTAAYWAEVRRVLTTTYHLRPMAAIRAIRALRAVLAKDGGGDVIYHSPVEQMAQGIVTGGYAAGEPSPTAKYRPRGRRSPLSKT